MSDSSQRTTVEIMGEQLPVKTAEGDSETERAVSLVESKISDFREQSRDASRLQVALLTCLNMAGRVVQLEESPDHLELSNDTVEQMNQLEERINSLINEGNDGHTNDV